MKKLLPALPIGALFSCLLWLGQAFAQTPDPRDSIIIESKTVNPGAGKPAARVKVYITNKDTLVAAIVGLVVKPLTGGAYMTLARPRTFDSVITRFTSTLPSWRTLGTYYYNSIPPDTITFGSFWEGETYSGYEPPNPVRKAFWEIKFDTVQSATGTLTLDSLKWGGAYYVHFVRWTNERAYDVEVNFVKGVITVAAPGPCGDFNGDGNFSTADAVAAANCLFNGEGDCGTISTAADIVRMLNALFAKPGRIPLLPPPLLVRKGAKYEEINSDGSVPCQPSLRL